MYNIERKAPRPAGVQDPGPGLGQGPGPRVFIMNAAFVFPEQTTDWYTAFVEEDLPRVAACLYTGINDLPFLRRAGAQLHAAGGTPFMLLVRDALWDLFPVHRYWLSNLAGIVLHAAWHGIGDWRRDAFPTIQLPQPDDLVIEV